LNYLQLLHPKLDEPLNNSELCEILQVSSVTLSTSNESDLQISYKVSEEDLCPRCRRFAAMNGVCGRCESVLKEKQML
jgi:isoleucyl-tRNA synthetase